MGVITVLYYIIVCTCKFKLCMSVIVANRGLPPTINNMILKCSIDKINALHAVLIFISCSINYVMYVTILKIMSK